MRFHYQNSPLFLMYILLFHWGKFDLRPTGFELNLSHYLNQGMLTEISDGWCFQWKQQDSKSGWQNRASRQLQIFDFRYMFLSIKKICNVRSYLPAPYHLMGIQVLLSGWIRQFHFRRVCHFLDLHLIEVSLVRRDYSLLFGKSRFLLQY